MVTENSTQKLWRGRIYAYAPLILWLAVIFINSSTVGATNNTSRIIRPLLEWLFPSATPAMLDVYHGYIRKLAHFTEYGVLSFLAARAFWASSQNVLRRFWYVHAFLLAALVAALDEYNQSFNNARTGSVYDVLIDVAGSLFAVAVLYVCNRRGRKTTRNMNKAV